jgi:predicted TIM-barrel fold metal-dependent hydrolase
MKTCFHLLALALASPAFTQVRADPADQGIIDAHLHAMSCTHNGLDQAAEWMKANGVTRAIVHPIDLSRDQNERDRATMLANFKTHEGRLNRFCIIKHEEVGSVEETVKILEQEKKDGAIGFGEHYGTGLMFDDPANMRLYEACAKVGLPVMFHMDDKQNKDTADFKHLENALKTHPNCIFIAHGPNWWKQFASGACERMLTNHANLYADLSAGSGANALSKDREHTSRFMIQHGKRLLFGTDCGWWSYGGKEKKPAVQFELIKSLDIPDEVKALIYRGNANRLFGFEQAALK